MQLSETGIIYRNSIPHLTSRHGYFPSLVKLSSGTLVSTYTVGEAFEATDLHTEIARSSDGGATWENFGPVFRFPDGEPRCEACRITCLADDTIVALISTFDRASHPGEGLSNEKTLGLVDTRFYLAESSDAGATWSAPTPIDTPIEGPSFELCAPILTLDDRWLLATSTWRSWEGREPNGMKMVALVSHDRGATWTDSVDVMADSKGSRIFWESKIVALADGRLLAVAWVFDEATGTDLPNHYALSTDRGASWTVPRSTALSGQTLTPVALPDGRVLSIYRRLDQPGLWAELVGIEHTEWRHLDELALWGGNVDAGGGAKGGASGMVQAFQKLRFGAPTAILLDAHTVLAACWAYEECVSVIRWFRIEV